MRKYDVAIVGGGIAGLTAAIYAAKGGKQTIIIEKQARLGGRAITNQKKGAYFNLGGHALYKGDAYETFHELGLELQGREPSIDAYGIWKGKLLTLPMGFKSLLTTPFLSWKGKMEVAIWLTKLEKMDTDQYNQISLRDWIEGNLRDPMVRHFFYSLLRTASYVVSPDLLVAGPVLKQLQRSLQGVLYVDKGWGTMVEQLRNLAEQSGVQFFTKSKAVTINHQDGKVESVLCADGTVFVANDIIVATSPEVTYQLVPHADQTRLQLWKDQAIEVTVASLDVALKNLPKPKQQFVYGIDQTVFFTHQSRAAHLSERGDQVICTLKYQGTTTDEKQDLQDLEQTLDLIQPGWRDELVVKQFLPKITVCYDFMHMKRQENPGPVVPEIAGLYVAGDWVTHGELLVDASIASAKRAVEHLLGKQKSKGSPSHEHRITV